MQARKQYFVNAERGISLTGLIAGMVVLGLVAVVAMKVVPAYAEYRSIQTGIVKAKEKGGSAAEMQQSFDKHAEVNGIEAVKGRDLVISRDGGEPDISFAYEKRLPLVANASLLIEYEGTTARNGVNAAKAAAAGEQ